ncbi:MAG: hypothetical protein ACOC1P_03885 [Minisyncoccales bacterium]
MLPITHIVLGFIFSAVLFFIFPEINLLEAGIIFLSSFLIDIDHYIYYVYKKKDLSLKNAYSWFIKKKAYFDTLSKEQRKKYSSGSFLFLHGIETLIILFLLSFLLELSILGFIAIGFSFHLITDWSVDRIYLRRLYKLSIIKDYINNKKLKNPEFIKKGV